MSKDIRCWVVAGVGVNLFPVIVYLDLLAQSYCYQVSVRGYCEMVSCVAMVGSEAEAALVEGVADACPGRGG